MAFRRKQTPFIGQKCTYEKGTKNLGRALPPSSFGQNPKEQLLFFVKPSLIHSLNHCDHVNFSIIEQPHQFFFKFQPEMREAEKKLRSERRVMCAFMWNQLRSSTSKHLSDGDDISTTPITLPSIALQRYIFTLERKH